MGWLQELVSWLFGMSLFVNSMLFLPQIFRLWKQKNSKDISLTTFAGFCIMQLIATLYGYFKNDFIMMGGYFISLLTCGCVTILICFYRIKRNTK